VSLNVLQICDGVGFHYKTVSGTRNPAFWAGAVRRMCFFLSITGSYFYS